jgi:2'-5' RNA ligase
MDLDHLSCTRQKTCTSLSLSTKQLARNGMFNGEWKAANDGLEEFTDYAIMKTYLEIKVPISFDAPWFIELRKALKDFPVYWQNGYYHITMAFLDETKNLPNVEAVMHKYLDNANAISVTFDKLDVFSTWSGLFIVHLTATRIPEVFQSLVNEIRNELTLTGSKIQSDFRLHVTLGRLSEPKADVDDIGFLIDEIDFSPLSLTLNEVEYREFRGRSIYKNKLK